MSTLETLQDLLIAEYGLSRDQLVPEAALTAVGLDSLGLIELMFQIEDRWGLTVPDDKAPVLVTIADLIAYVDTLLAARAAAPLPSAESTIRAV